MTKRHRDISAWLAVVATFRTCEQRYADLLERFGLSIAQYEVLNVLFEAGGAARPSEIAGRLLVTKGNVTALLSRLEAAGWVSRDVHPTDGRARLCALTARARRVVGPARAAAARFIDAQCAPFSASDLAYIETLMNRMRTHLLTLDVAALAERRRAVTAR